MSEIIIAALILGAILTLALACYVAIRTLADRAAQAWSD
jgi:hypothetical protein